MMKIKQTKYFLLFICLLSFQSIANDGKLIGTAGLSQVEGAGGGGLVPWAILSGYDSRDEISVSAALSQADLKNYRLNVQALSASFYDQFELSVAQQRFDLLSLGGEIKMNVFGAKYKVYGDAVYAPMGQVSVGIQHKSLENKAVANLLGANDTTGTDFYIAMSKIHLGAVAGYNAVWNITARATKANEMGLLGFGSANQDSYELMLEASAGVLFSRHFAVGVEYRQKPDNLGLGEDDWFDFFATYIPSKSVSFTAAWTELGTIAGAEGQSGLYLSINGHF